MRLTRVSAAALFALTTQAVAETEYPTAVCLGQLSQDPRLELIRTKVQLAGGDPNIAVLAQTEKPTSDERPVILEWAKAVEDCFKLGAAYREQTHPAERAIAERLNAATRSLRLALYNGELTYGQYGERREQAYLSAKSEWAAIESRLQAENARDRWETERALQELQNRQPTAAEAFLEGFNRGRPQTTSCRRTLTGIDCSTRR